MVNRLDPLPEQWRGRYDDSSRNNDSWYGQSRKAKPEKTLEAVVSRIRPDVSVSERYHVVSLMTKGFRYLPQDRITAAELLRDESFQQVMGFYEL